MESELLFNGSPRDFGLMADELSRRLQRDKKVIRSLFGPFHLENKEQVKANIDENPVIVHIQGEVVFTDQTEELPRLERLLGYPGRVEAYRVPGGKSRLRLIVRNENWPQVEPNWKLLYDEMKRQGWLDPVKPAPQQLPTGAVILKEPAKDAPLDDWVIWWYEMNIRYYEQGRTGHRPTLKDVAEKAGRSDKTINTHKTRDPHHKFIEYKERLSAVKKALKDHNHVDDDEDT